MELFGVALQAFYDGDSNAELIIGRNDGQNSPVLVSHFFRNASECMQIDRCRGYVLDTGAGTGLHSLALHKKGLPVISIDISGHAVEIMKEHGIKDAHCADIFAFEGAYLTRS